MNPEDKFKERIKYDISLPCFIHKEGDNINVTKPLVEWGVTIRSVDENTSSITLRLQVPEKLIIDCIQKQNNILFLTIKDSRINEDETEDEITPEEWDEILKNNAKDFWDWITN